MRRLLLGTTAVMAAFSSSASANADVDWGVDKTRAAVNESARSMSGHGSGIILLSDRIDPSEGPDPEPSGIDPKEGPDPESSSEDDPEGPDPE